MWCVHVCCFSRLWLFETLWSINCHVLLSWDSPGKNTGVSFWALNQEIFPTQESNLCLLSLWHWQADSYHYLHLLNRQVGSLPPAPPGKPRTGPVLPQMTGKSRLALLDPELKGSHQESCILSLSSICFFSPSSNTFSPHRDKVIPGSFRERSKCFCWNHWWKVLRQILIGPLEVTCYVWANHKWHGCVEYFNWPVKDRHPFPLWQASGVSLDQT